MQTARSWLTLLSIKTESKGEQLTQMITKSASQHPENSEKMNMQHRDTQIVISTNIFLIQMRHSVKHMLISEL